MDIAQAHCQLGNVRVKLRVHLSVYTDKQLQITSIFCIFVKFIPWATAHVYTLVHSFARMQQGVMVYHNN